MLEKLSNLAKFNSGLIISRERPKCNDSAQYRVLNYRCIDENGVVDIRALDVMDLNRDIDDKFITRLNDIVVKLVHPFKAALIEKDMCGILITSNFCKITCEDKILPEYLVAYLNSRVIEKKLSKEAKNQTMNQVNIRDLEKIEIEMHDKHKQKIIASIYQSYIKKIKITNEILKAEEKIIKNIC